MLLKHRKWLFICQLPVNEEQECKNPRIKRILPQSLGRVRLTWDKVLGSLDCAQYAEKLHRVYVEINVPWWASITLVCHYFHCIAHQHLKGAFAKE